MSYGVSAALQAAVFQRLTGDAPLAGLIGGAIYDELPSGTLPSTYVTLGPETVLDLSSKTSRGATHEFVVAVVTDTAGFSGAKTVAAAVSDTLTDAALILSRGRLFALNFLRAKAVRVGTADERQILLTFRAFVEDD